MRKQSRLRDFLTNERAVSEEFTALPALSVVMIGFALFFVLFANVYTSYGLRVESLDKYQTADFLLTKLTHPDSPFIKPGGSVDFPLLQSSDGAAQLRSLRHDYSAAGVNFTVRVNWDDISHDFPEPLPDTCGDRIAVSTSASIYLNEAQTMPGTLTIIAWGVLS